ncbi:YusW family protein [Planococcus sp. N028]|uniref:YusW family protein n=1 Tax=Planococcus shixiaomingii TaxID=3058393 RepID=A0ABT8N2F4_9BACL|nr:MULTISPECIES: YusW family protein [unclassified Planococcus (in: firmicutes)]MDN7241879.1 YusW family protein [Planococcus sp. N028]WKA54164.1 YusW family protein [Planococcus sp. N022]
MSCKKSSIMTALLLSSTLALAACGGSDEVTEPIQNDAATDPNKSNADAATSGGIDSKNVGGKTFGFTDFEMSVDYPDQDDAIEVSYEEDREKVEAEYTNKFEKLELKGNDAWNEMETAFLNMELQPDMTNEDVIPQVVEAFGLKEGYSNIEIDVQYQGGEDKEYQASGN